MWQLFFISSMQGYILNIELYKMNKNRFDFSAPLQLIYKIILSFLHADVL